MTIIAASSAFAETETAILLASNVTGNATDLSPLQVVPVVIAENEKLSQYLTIPLPSSLRYQSGWKVAEILEDGVTVVICVVVKSSL